MSSLLIGRNTLTKAKNIIFSHTLVVLSNIRIRNIYVVLMAYSYVLVHQSLCISASDNNTLNRFQFLSVLYNILNSINYMIGQLTSN